MAFVPHTITVMQSDDGERGSGLVCVSMSGTRDGQRRAAAAYESAARRGGGATPERPVVTPDPTSRPWRT